MPATVFVGEREVIDLRTTSRSPRVAPRSTPVNLECRALFAWYRLGGSISQDFTPHIQAEAGLDDHPPVPEGWLINGLARDGLNHVLLRPGLFGGNENQLQGAMQKLHEVFSTETDRLDWATVPSGGGVLPTGRHYPGRHDDDPDA